MADGTESSTANALLKAEKDEALDLLRVRHTLQLEEAAAQLDTERKEKDEAVRKLKSIVAEINGSETLQEIRRTLDSSVTTTTATALDRGNPGVVVLSNNVRSKNTTTNTCTFSVDIHEEPEVLLEALFGEQTKVGKTLFQKVIGEGVAYWSFMVEGNKSCDLVLRMLVEEQDEDRVVIRVESVEEDLVATSLPKPH
ncbi:hypothetical protein TrST_g8509 [Triparma strigata]|uniref:Uncharacterized protein n=1 Tax=Triparma strigata TaxID=1606541 RepID=A0A9W7AS74_9STRA|nr:hypothetical protein TrST_g8509 [Triparma strigata]